MLKCRQILCILIVFTLACNVVTPKPSPFPAQPAQGTSDANTSAPPNQAVPIVILKTKNPDFALMALFEKGETLIAMTTTNATGEVVDVTGVIFIAPDGRSIAVYFENGLPVRAIAEGHVVEFYNLTESTVDVVIVAPDGTVTTQADVPFDAKKIYQVNKTSLNNPGGRPLAAISLAAQNQDIDWIQFASTAFGAFSCAATIASGGTLSLLFGVGCAFFVYTTYFKMTEQEIPILVEVGDNTIGAVACGVELAEKNVMAVPDCGKLVLDAARTIQESSSQTYEKQKRVVEEIKLNSSVSPIGMPLPCSDSSLTAEEKINCGIHTYNKIRTVTSFCTTLSTDSKTVDVEFIFSKDSVTRGTNQYSEIDTNSYRMEQGKLEPDSNIDRHVYVITFSHEGFSVDYSYEGSVGLIDCYQEIYTLVK